MRFCPICRGEVDPADPTVVLAAKFLADEFTGRPRSRIAEPGDYLHKRCFYRTPVGHGYRLKPK